MERPQPDQFPQRFTDQLGHTWIVEPYRFPSMTKGLFGRTIIDAQTYGSDYPVSMTVPEDFILKVMMDNGKRNTDTVQGP